MENVLIIGQGEIGKPLAKFIEEANVFNVYKKDIEPLKLEEKVDVMHICLPLEKPGAKHWDNGEWFKQTVCNYIQEYKPTLTINDSTVTPGTTDDIYKKTNALIVHSPYRGDHKLFSEHIKKWVKFIGPTSKKAGELAEVHFQKMGVPCEILENAKTTELGKLWDTTYYALTIAIHQEMERYCKTYGVNFDQASKRFSETFIMGKDYKNQRPVLFSGAIKGHCLIPNAQILYRDLFKYGFRSEFLELLFASDTQKREELGLPNEIIREE